MQASPPIRFNDGAQWVRADFHLHTDADREFKTPPSDTYESDFAEGLKKAGIQVGAITNHNKFDFDEFKKLRKAAKKHTLLLPGVELSTDEGANGVHTLVIFGDDWLKNNQDRISPFISSMFPGKAAAEYQSENGRSDKGLLAVIDELEKCRMKYFVIFAHVEQRSGLWRELKGGKLGDFKDDRHKTLRERVLGFQKVRTHDTRAAGRPDDFGRSQIKQFFEDWYPAEVEGSDCKSLAEIGKGKSSFLKLGELSFSAVEFALHDHQQRVVTGEQPAAQTPPFLSEIRFQGGRLDGQVYPLNSQLSCLIGSRGGGKSSVIETLRFALGIDPGSDDARYKNGLVEAVLGNGGEIIVSGTGIDGSEFSIQRALNYAPRVSLEGKETKLKPSDIIPDFLYFGQKDLGNRHDQFEEDFFSQLLGRRSQEDLEAEKSLEAKVHQAVDHWNGIRDAVEKESSYQEQAEQLRDTLAIYKKHGIEKQLEELTRFDADKQNLQDLIARVEEFLNDLEDFPESVRGIQTDWPSFESPSLKKLSKPFVVTKDRFVKANEGLDKMLTEYRLILAQLNEARTELLEIEKQQQDQFIELQRKAKAPEGLNLQAFRAQKSRLAQLDKLLKASKNTKSARKDALESAINAALKLHDSRRSWHCQEQAALAKKAKNLPTDLKLVLQYEADREAFRDFLGGLVSGQRVRRSTLEMLSTNYDNGLVMLQKRAEVFKKLESSADGEKIKAMMTGNLAAILSYEVPKSRQILFKEASIQALSLGQRATALLQLLMSVDGHPLFIIDQPEDDLDNETIFRNVVEPLLEKKKDAQFLIATHNPNIPVLGDAELVHACNLGQKPQGGSLDSSITRDAIVAIMEGGQRAFEKRQQVYKQWTNIL